MMVIIKQLTLCNYEPCLEALLIAEEKWDSKHLLCSIFAFCSTSYSKQCNAPFSLCLNPPNSWIIVIIKISIRPKAVHFSFVVGCRFEVRTSLVSVQFCSHCSGFRLIRWARRPRLASRFFMSNSLISNQRGENPFRQMMFLQITLNHSALLQAPNNYSHANFNTLIFSHN